LAKKGTGVVKKGYTVTPPTPNPPQPKPTGGPKADPKKQKS